MIKVIKRVEPKVQLFRKTCFNCKSELEYTAKDIEFSSDSISHYSHIKCPVCGYRLSHTVSYSV